MSFAKSHRLNPKTKTRFVYRRGFSLWPIKCSNGKWIWLRHYMIKYKEWIISNSWIEDIEWVENISDDEYIIRKLTNTL